MCRDRFNTDTRRYDFRNNSHMDDCRGHSGYWQETEHIYRPSNMVSPFPRRFISNAEFADFLKKYLKELIWEELGEAREKREYYLSHMDEVHDILAMGAKKAQAIAQSKMEKVREAIGLI